MIWNANIALETAKLLLETDAVKINLENPFTWASGIKSPIYCDNRITLSYPKSRALITNYLSQLATEKFGTDIAIAGVATAGIAQAALIANQLNCPMGYVRSKPKEHGLKNAVEGLANFKGKVVVIEDLVSTGGSSLSSIQNLQNEGFHVVGLLSIFSYGFEDANELFMKNNIPFYSLSDYENLIHFLSNSGKFDEKEVSTLLKWRANPKNWLS